MHKYSVKITWIPQGEPYHRKGILSAPGLKDIVVVTPPEFKHGIPNEWTPEHLFIASVFVCTMTTFLAISEASKLEYEHFHIETTGFLDDIEVDGRKQPQITEINQKFHIKLKSKNDEMKTRKILEKTERDCLIANSMKSKVTLEPIFK